MPDATPTTTPTPILTESIGPIRRITLNRPEARNAQSRELLDALDATFEAARIDDSVRVVILAARGPHFSAGHDLKQAQSERAAFSVEERWTYESERYYDYCLRIWSFPKPVIAQVQGACVAAGFMLANMCDLIVASEDAVFSDPVTLTLGAAATEVLIHPWVLGLRKAKELLFTGARMTALEAKEAGMVNRVVASGSGASGASGADIAALEAATLEMARTIAKAPPFAIRLLKKSLNRSMEVQGMHQAMSAHFDVHQLSHVTDEYRAHNQSGLSNAIGRGKGA